MPHPKRQGGQSDSVEVTPEMIKAGVAAFETWSGSCHDEMLVAQVYSAMNAAQSDPEPRAQRDRSVDPAHSTDTASR